MGDRVVMDAMILVEHVVLDMVIGWWTRILGCVAVVVCNFGLSVSKIRPFTDLLYTYSRRLATGKKGTSNLDPNV